MRRMLVLLAAMCVPLGVTAGIYSPATPLQISPGAPAIPSYGVLVASNVGKIVWSGTADRAYIIERKFPGGPWKTFGIETAYRGVSRKSVFLERGPDNASFRVGRTASVPTSTRILCTVSAPVVPRRAFSKSTAVWAWENGVVRWVPAWQPMAIAFSQPGTKRVTVTLIGPDRSRVSKQWAVTVRPKVAPSNLVFNGDLEQVYDGQSPPGWMRGGFGNNDRAFHYPVSGAGGGTGIGVSVTEYVDGDAKWFFQNVQVKPGFRYRYANRYNANVPTVITLRWGLDTGEYIYPDVAMMPPGIWEQGAADFVAPPNAVLLTVFHSLISPGELTLDNVSVVSRGAALPLHGGIISLDFDGGWKQTFDTVAPVLETAGFPATFYVPSAYVNADSGRITSEDIVRLRELGHEIGSSGITYANLRSLDSASAEAEINASRHELLKAGAGNVKVFAYPRGAYDWDIRDRVREAGYIAARTGNQDSNVQGADPYALKTLAVSGVSSSEVYTRIDSALRNKEWLILVFEHVNYSGSYSVTPEYFQEVVNFLKNREAAIVTTAEGARLIQ